MIAGGFVMLARSRLRHDAMPTMPSTTITWTVAIRGVAQVVAGVFPGIAIGGGDLRRAVVRHRQRAAATDSPSGRHPDRIAATAYDC
jgi:undecaprenyl pyrophosphate phosphatase UppP